MKVLSLFKRKPETPVCSAVIVAAGSSQRMGSDKLQADLGSMPVLARTLLAFQRSALVEEIVVVTRMDRVAQVADLCKEYKIDKASKVICGGKTRVESALAGVSEVSPKAKLIAIHDGARPLVTEEVILRTVHAAQEYLAAAPAVKSTDTLKAVDEKGFIIGTVDRESVLRIQTPQVFKAEFIKGALTKAVKDGLPVTDDCSAMELMGVKCRTVPGDEDNIKITTPRDLALAAAILKDRGEIL